MFLQFKRLRITSIGWIPLAPTLYDDVIIVYVSSLHYFICVLIPLIFTNVFDNECYFLLPETISLWKTVV